MKNANAYAAALTSFFVWAISRVVAHFGLVSITPSRILVAAGACTYLVLWIGRDGIKGAARRLWNGSAAIVNGHQPKTPAKN
jgi:hypothetical protein